MRDGGYIVLTFVRGPEASTDVMQNVDEYRTLTMNYIMNETETVCRLQFYHSK
jgi:hypothetical protein